MQIAFTGDVMLGITANELLYKDKFTCVWGDTLDIIRTADLFLINLECVISSIDKQWNRTFKVFNFRNDPNTINVLGSRYRLCYLWETTMYWIMRRALLDMLD